MKPFLKAFFILSTAAILSSPALTVADPAEPSTGATFSLAVRMRGPTIIQSGAPVVLRTHEVGVVESVRTEDAKTMMSLSLSESIRGALKRGSVVLVSMRKSGRVLELLIPDESKDLLDLNTPIPGYSSFEQYWLDAGQGKRER